jgi:hypothetical protein
MLSVRAIYDGNDFRLKRKISIRTPKEVIITFLEPEEADDEETDPTVFEIHQMMQDGGAVGFLDDDREDIYSDADLSVKYR